MWPKVSYISTSDTLQALYYHSCNRIFIHFVQHPFIFFHFDGCWSRSQLSWSERQVHPEHVASLTKLVHTERDDLSHLWATGMSFDPCGKTWRLRPQPAGGLKSWMSSLWGCSAYHHTTFLHSGMMVIPFQSNRIRDIKVPFGCL